MIENPIRKTSFVFDLKGGPVKLKTYVLQCDSCRVVILDTSDMHRHGIQHCITCGSYKFTLRCSDGSEEKIDTTPKP